MTSPTIDIEALKAVAEKATPSNVYYHTQDRLDGWVVRVDGGITIAGFYHTPGVDRAAENAAFIAAANPAVVLSLIARTEAAEGESADLTKALTGLTCGGSEFFIRKGDRYVADINACVAWVKRRDTAAHERWLDVAKNLKAEQARTAELVAQRDGLAEVVKNLARCLLPIHMGMMEREMVGDPIPPAAVVLSFMGSGASDSVTAHEVSEAIDAANTALSTIKAGGGE